MCPCVSSKRPSGVPDGGDEVVAGRNGREKYFPYKKSFAESIIYLSTNLYASLSFFECLQCLSNWEVQTWQMAPCQNRWDCAVLLKLVSL